MNIKKNKNSNIDEEINNLSCPLCYSRLLFKHINLNNKMIFCSNKKCLFPMNLSDMNKFIIEINTGKVSEFILNIKKLVFEQSLSNDTNCEEKFKKINKDELNGDSKNLDCSDILSNNEQHHFFDSFSENDNLQFE